MSGGGGSKKKSSSKDKASDDAVPAYLGGGVQSTFPQALPGQLEAIAAQLSAGYGAPQAQNMAFLDSLYSPMNVPMQASSNAPLQNVSPPGNEQSELLNQLGRGQSGWRQRRDDAGRR